MGGEARRGDAALPATALEDLQVRLQAQAQPKVRAWWTNYLKGTAEFRGVRMDDVRSTVHAWWDRHGFGGAQAAAPVWLPLLPLLRQPMTEDKLAAMLVLSERLIPAGAIEWREALPDFAALFDEGHLHDWNAVDWFCVKVLGPLAESLHGDERRAYVETVTGWRAAPTLWRRRASAVAFVNLVKRGDAFSPGLVDGVLTSCEVLVASEERFSQTGAGWVLRELSVAEPRRVRDFVERHGDQMSTEALRSASKKLP